MIILINFILFISLLSFDIRDIIFSTVSAFAILMVIPNKPLYFCGFIMNTGIPSLTEKFI